MTALEVRWYQESESLRPSHSGQGQPGWRTQCLRRSWPGGYLSQDIAGCFFELVRCRQPSSDKLEQASAYSVVLILLGQHQAVSSAGQKFFFVDVRARHRPGLLEPASGCAQSPLRRRCPFSNLARRFFSEPQGFQAFGLGAFGFALCFVLGHGFGAFGGSLFLFELRFRPFPLLGVVGQRSLLLSLETRSSYSSRCRCARSSERPSRLAAVPLARTRGGPVRTIPAPITLSAVIQATEALAPKRSPSEDMLRRLLQNYRFLHRSNRLRSGDDASLFWLRLASCDETPG